MSADRTQRHAARSDLEDPAVASPERTCPLCGGRIRASSDREHCPSCPVAKQCKILCCPHCGYEFVEDSALVSGLAGLLRRLSGKGEGKGKRRE